MKIKHLPLLILLAVPAVTLTGCKKGVGERAGEKMDQGAQKAGDVMEDVGDKTEDAVDKVK